MSKSLQKKFEKIPTSTLGIYGSQVIAFIQDLSKTFTKLNQIRNTKEIDFNVDVIGSALWEKQKECEKMYNQIMLEMERRMKKDIGLDFNYPMYSKNTEIVDKVLEGHFGKMSAQQKDEQTRKDIEALGNKLNNGGDPPSPLLVK